MKKFITGLLTLLLTFLLLPCNDKNSSQKQQSQSTFTGIGTRTNGRTRYMGELLKGRFNGYGELSIGDSLIYSGQWRAGKRCGRGLSHDSLGRTIDGIWHADTLISGTRRDASGIYIGQMDRRGMAHGHGRYIYANGDTYEGRWQNDRRDGFGFLLSAHHHIKAGEWKRDKYYGERVLYTSERIYGIDISKYQHIAGKRYYAIHWNRIRIAHLGTISRKRVRGTVDYPISFVYIKSTEGKTVRNPYYSADYRQAKAHGLHVGSYHFFSILSHPTAQAAFFLRHSYFRKGDFPPVLDVEPTPDQIRRMGGTEVLFNHIRTWLRIVHRRIGARPVLYVSQMFVNRYLPLAPDIKKQYDVWIARYGEYKPDVRLVYWQLCPDGHIRGIHGEVDISVFNGFRPQFDEFVRSKTIP